MGDLSHHFNRREFACRCGCGQDTVDYKLVEVLEKVRKWAGAPVTITSGNRCPEYNKKIGGSPTSKHMNGKAADFSVQGWSPKDIYNLLDEWFPHDKGVREYSTWVHFDVRADKYRKGLNE